MRIGGPKIHGLSTQMSRTSKAISSALERLASGNRVARPADDIAAYSMGVRMEAKSRGLQQIIRGMNDAKGSLGFTENAIQSQIEVVQQMREIALQASSSLIDANERANLTNKLQTLLSEYRRLSQSVDTSEKSILGSDTGSQILIPQIDLSDTANFQRTVGVGTFGSRKTISSFAASQSVIKAEDVNADGKVDVLTVSGTTLNIALGAGNGSFTLSRTYALTGSVRNLFLTDIDGDGHQDIAYGDYDNLSVQYLKGYGDGTYASSSTLLASFSGGALAIADFNADWIADILDETDLSLNDGHGQFGALTPTGGASDGFSFVVGDLNGDGYNDYIAQTGGFYDPTVYLNLKDGTFTSGWAGSIFRRSNDLVLADFNNDGILDLYHPAESGSSQYLYLGDGDGTFTFKADLAISDLSLQVEVADINNDGYLDIVHSNRVINLGRGDGTFSRITSAFTGANFSSGLPSFALADLTNDGVIDIVGFSTTNLISLIGNSIQKSASAHATDISTTQKSQDLLRIVDTTLTNLKSKMSQVTALHSRLDFASTHSLLQVEVLEEARSRMSEVDMALETAEVVRLQILQQAQVAVRAQANLSMSLVLKLLDSLA